MKTAPKSSRSPLGPQPLPPAIPVPSLYGRFDAPAEPQRETTRRLDLERLLRREPMPSEYFLG
jgi:hypothetical protein